MALKNPSLFLYGYQITPNNQYISFGTNSGEAPPNSRTAVVPVGYYSLTSLMTAVASAMSTADPTHTYTLTADRTAVGGLQNRVTISTSNTYLSIYFSTGNPSNPASLLGFATSNLTGSTSYTGTSTSGTVLVPGTSVYNYGFNYLSPNALQKNFGKLNVSASGVKEAIVFSLQSFLQVQFQYITEANVTAQWLPLIQWMIQQRAFEFTPDITAPATFYQVTFEDPNSGLSMDLAEMLPDFPFYYKTPLLKFRVVNT